MDLIVLQLEKSKTKKFRAGGADAIQYQFGDLSAHSYLTYDQLLEIKTVSQLQYFYICQCILI